METHSFPIGGYPFAWHIASPCLPDSARPWQWSSRRADRSWRVILAARETDAFAVDATEVAHSHAVLTPDRDSPASGEVASIPMRIWLGRASNWSSFSSQTCQPSLLFVKVSGLTTTLLSGRQMQPAQDWLPKSIPQTYLIVACSSEGEVAILITYLLSFRLPIPGHPPRDLLAPRSASIPSQEARASAHLG